MDSLDIDIEQLKTESDSAMITTETETKDSEMKDEEKKEVEVKDEDLEEKKESVHLFSQIVGWELTVSPYLDNS